MARTRWLVLVVPVLLGASALVAGLRLPSVTLPLAPTTALGVLAAALVITGGVLLRRAQRRAGEERRLWQAELELAHAEGSPELLRVLAERARDLTAAEASAVCLWDAEKQGWALQGASGATDAFVTSASRAAPRGGDPQVECPIVRLKYRQAHLARPLLQEGQVVGCCCVASQHPHAFSDHARGQFEELARQGSRAIAHTQRWEQAWNRGASAERERLAREMHDTVAQVLGFVNLKTLAARELLVQGEADQARLQLEQLGKVAQDSYADTRELILGLRSGTGPERGLVPALADYVERFSQFGEVATTLDVDEFDGARLLPSAETQVIRVVQEALSNVRKHARAHQARVRVEHAAGCAHVTIEDDGKGFDPADLGRGAWPHVGLQSMRERVESIGGDLAVRSAPGRGTTVALRVPLVYRSESAQTPNAGPAARGAARDGTPARAWDATGGQ